MGLAREINFDLNAPQFRAFQALSDRRSLFLGWGRGVGKTWFLLRMVLKLIAEHEYRQRKNCPKRLRGVRVVVYMPTLVQFKDVYWSEIENELLPGGEWDWLGAKLNAQRGQVTFPGGSSIKPFPSTAHHSKKARGIRCDVILADEIDDTDADAYDAVAIPWLSEPWSLGIQLKGGTPTRGRHGLWYRELSAAQLAERIRNGELSHEEALKSDVAKAIREVLTGIEAKHWPEHLPRDVDQATIWVLTSQYGWKATYEDAPETVSPLAVAQARASMPDATFKREWEADPDAGEGIVYPFDDDFHVRVPPDGVRFAEFAVGMDHGWEDPGVLLKCGIIGHGEDGTLWVLEESYEQYVPNHVWNERAELWRSGLYFPDPSRPDRVNDLRMMGLRVGDTDNDILAGIARVADRLFIRRDEDGERWSRLYVHPRCVNTIREFGKYRRKKRPDGSFDEKPEDKNNHAMDALRYACMGIFGRLPNFKHTASGR